MSSDNIERPLLLNESMKDSIEQPVVSPSPIKNLEQSAPREEPEAIHQEEAEDNPSPQIIDGGRENNPQTVAALLAFEEEQEEEQKQTDKKKEDVTYSIVQESISPKKQKKRYKCMQACGIVCVLIGIVLIFAIPPFLHSFIVSEAINKVVMQPDNQELWGQFPGQSATIIVRNFTFHRLMNEDDFLLRHRKPQFQEVTGFKIQQLQDFLDITYLEDGNKVKVRDWTRFVQWAESKDLDTPVSILNMGSLGYWSTLKAARPTMILQQGLALLFTNMEQSLLPTLLGTGINSQFLPNSSSAIDSLLAPSGVQEQNFDFMWSDPSYGLYNPENLGEWAQAALETFQSSNSSYSYSPTANTLKNYFVLTDVQMKALLEKIYGYIVNLKKILLENHYCADIDMKDCTGRYLSVAQITDGWVTASPPPVSTITPNDTICDNNFTCKGYYPELYAFQKHVFWGTNGASKVPSNADITFNRQQIQAWFNYNKSVTEGLNYNTAEDCLMHIGNLDQIWEWGTNYDMDYDLEGMAKIQRRLKLQNETQAIVVWEWLKYLANTFVKQKDKTEKLGLANLFTQGLYSEFAKTQDRLQPFLIQKMLKKVLSTKECHLFFEATLEEPEGSPLVDSLCNHYTDIHSDQFASFMLSTCEEKYGPAWQELRNLGVSLMTLQYHCQTDKDGNLGSMIHKIKMNLNKKYNCSMTPKPYCSNFQLALQQWANSTITLNPPEIEDVVKKSATFHDWNKEVKSYEYGFYLNKFTEEERKDFPLFSLQQLYPVFIFQEWFSASSVLREVIAGGFGKDFINYLRWVAITVTLNGYTTTRTVRQILFGYEDEFLAEIKNQYPPFGGDPSAPSLIALNDPNDTETSASTQIVFLTGKDDFRNVYQNYQINGFRYSVNNYSWFDGNKTNWAWKSPWAEDDYFYGTTAKIFAPNQFEADNLSLMINQVQRYGSNFFHNESFLRPRYGIDLYISYLSPYIGQVAPHNDKYYQTLPNVFNVSSIYGLPLYITKNHFMNCTDWLDLVDIFNQDYSIRYQNVSQWDDTFILVEPYTGVSFQSQIYLQNNYYHQPDFLYHYPVQTMLPIFTISRSGNLTQEKFHELYDPLVIGLKVKTAMVYIGISFVVVFGGMLVFAIYKKRQVKKREIVVSSLGISLQEQRGHNEEEGKEPRLTIQVED